jgi:hypothetical protein
VDFAAGGWFALPDFVPMLSVLSLSGCGFAIAGISCAIGKSEKAWKGSGWMVLSFFMPNIPAFWPK